MGWGEREGAQEGWWRGESRIEEVVASVGACAPWDAVGQGKIHCPETEVPPVLPTLKLMSSRCGQCR